MHRRETCSMEAFHFCGLVQPLTVKGVKQILPFAVTLHFIVFVWHNTKTLSTTVLTYIYCKGQHYFRCLGRDGKNGLPVFFLLLHCYIKFVNNVTVCCNQIIIIICCITHGYDQTTLLALGAFYYGATKRRRTRTISGTEPLKTMSDGWTYLTERQFPVRRVFHPSLGPNHLDQCDAVVDGESGRELLHQFGRIVCAYSRPVGNKKLGIIIRSTNTRLEWWYRR